MPNIEQSAMKVVVNSFFIRLNYFILQNYNHFRNWRFHKSRETFHNLTYSFNLTVLLAVWEPFHNYKQFDDAGIHTIFNFRINGMEH